MRIISGRWRSRKIDWPDTGKTRPVTDRVREAIFDGLGSRLQTPGHLPPVQVADVFCGGGSFGLEALSRGATQACFFERDARALAVLKQNLQRLEAGPEATICAGDVWRHGIRPPDGFGPLDLVFLDPPFVDARSLEPRSKLGAVLRRLATGKAVHAGTVLVFRHEGKCSWPAESERYWQPLDERSYGRNVVWLLSPATPANAAADSEIPDA